MLYSLGSNISKLASAFKASPEALLHLLTRVVRGVPTRILDLSKYLAGTERQLTDRSMGLAPGMPNYVAQVKLMQTLGPMACPKIAGADSSNGATLFCCP